MKREVKKCFHSCGRPAKRVHTYGGLHDPVNMCSGCYRNTNMNKMSDLMRAFSIFMKYGDLQWPVESGCQCIIVNMDYDVVSDMDKLRLKVLGFHKSTECDDGFETSRYNSN